MTALTLQLPSALKFTDEEFEQLVAVNKELRLELTVVSGIFLAKIPYCFKLAYL